MKLPLMSNIDHWSPIFSSFSIYPTRYACSTFRSQIAVDSLGRIIDRFFFSWSNFFLSSSFNLEMSSFSHKVIDLKLNSFSYLSAKAAPLVVYSRLISRMWLFMSFSRCPYKLIYSKNFACSSLT